MSTVSSQDDQKHTLSVTVQMPEEEEEEEEDGSQTLTEFFKENQAVDTQASRLQGSFSTSDGEMEMSAATYLNRQASLLMLWFPLAVSGLRKCNQPPADLTVSRRLWSITRETDLRHGSRQTKSSPPSHLTLVRPQCGFDRLCRLCESAPYAAAGADDQGLAELVIRRRVRRKMPDMAA